MDAETRIRSVLRSVLLGGLLGLAACASTPQTAERTTVTGTMLDGSRYAYVPGQPTLFVFWASWCESCRRESPSLVALNARPDLDVIGINIDLDRTDATAAVGQLELTYPSIYDPDLAVWDSFSVSATPTLVLVDADGVMVKRTNSTSYLPQSFDSDNTPPTAR